MYKEINKLIKKYNSIVIARHVGGDIDALGSQIGLKEIIKEGKPIVIMVHWPLHTERFTRTFIGRDRVSPVLCVPEELMNDYPERAKEKFTADEATKTMYDLIKGEPLIKAVLTGHEHMDFTDEINGKPHLLTGLYSIRIINIV